MAPNSTPHGAIIQLLSQQELTLAALAQATRVSLPTLRRAIHDLTLRHWVAPTGENKTTGGRPAMLYGLDASYHFIIGAHLQLPGLRIAAVDLTGHVLHDKHLERDELTPDAIMRDISREVHDAVDHFAQRNLLGLGVAAPGFTDPDSGTILSIGRVPGWHNYPLQARLEASFGLPVTIANDIDCMAIAELEHLSSWPNANVVYLGFGEGIKASLFLEGKQYTGPFGNAGNIGRSVLPVHDASNGPQVAKLEHLVSLRAISQAFDARASHAIQQQDASEFDYAAIQQMTSHRAKFRRIVEAAEEGSALCQQLLADMLDTLAIAIANLLHALQPGLLIAGGVLSDLSPAMYTYFDAAVRSHLPPLISHYLVIQKAAFAMPNQVCIGAARTFLQHHLLTDDSFMSVGEKAP